VTSAVRLLTRLFDLLSSLGLACVLIVLLFALTYLGTLYQVDHGLYEAQKTYFDSWWLVQQVGPVPVPLPGGLAVMSLLFVNLLIGGVVRLKFTRRRIGILVTHAGILLLLLAGFVKFAYAEEGALRLYEGDHSAAYRSYYDWEIALIERLPDGGAHEYVIPQGRFRSLADERTVTFEHASIPFALEVSAYVPNARPLPKGPMFEVKVPVVDGFFLQEQPLAIEAEVNLAGCYATLRDGAGETLEEGILWGGALAPWVVDAGGRPWVIELRKKRMPLPFDVTLDSTQRTRYPGTTKPRTFSSNVTVVDPNATQDVLIQMNEPLRHKGFVLFQSGWGPEEPRPGDRLFSVFSVVRNPADQWPLYACIIIAAGLLIHFSQALARHVRRETGASS